MFLSVALLVGRLVPCSGATPSWSAALWPRRWGCSRRTRTSGCPSASSPPQCRPDRRFCRSRILYLLIHTGIHPHTHTYIHTYMHTPLHQIFLLCDLLPLCAKKESKLREYPGLLEQVIAALKGRFAEVCLFLRPCHCHAMPCLIAIAWWRPAGCGQQGADLRQRSARVGLPEGRQ